LFNAAGGGTGSGMAWFIMNGIKEEFELKKTNINYSIYPSPKLNSCAVPNSFLEPYNSVFYWSGILECSDM
jgi:hypothetical protein